jgi:hypothetical protein
LTARSLDELIAALLADSARHILCGSASEQDLASIESLVGQPLPAPYRTLLLRLGGGLLYDRHELFGPRITMIHDIDLVPDLASVRRRLEAEQGAEALVGRLPLHRGTGKVHLIDVRPDPAPVATLDRAETYPDLAAFLEAVVLPH